MPVFERRLALPHSAEQVWSYHMRPGAFSQLAPPWDPLRIIEWEGVYKGARQVFEVNLGVRQRWVAVIDRFEDGVEFRDTQLKGPFAHWRHSHRVEATDEGCVLIDRIDYALPLGAVGAAAGGWYARRNLERVWAWRHHRMRWDLDRIAATARHGPKTIAVTGATGFVGAKLCAFLGLAGHTVRRVVRRDPQSDSDILWKPSKGQLEAHKLEGVDAVVHLAGAPIAVRWTDDHAARIRDSRVEGTRLLASALAGLERRPEVLLSGSAVGVYGYQDGGAVKDEAAPVGDGFAASVCEDWEAAAEPARQAGIRVVHPRIGIVMGPDGGALSKMLPVFRAGGGGPLGSGAQYFPWVAADDLVAALYFMLFTPDLRGPVNAVSPNPCAQRAFARALGAAVGRPAILPAPAFAIRAAMGRMGVELLLGGQRVVPAKLAAAGFVWEAPLVETSLDRMLGGPRS